MPFLAPAASSAVTSLIIVTYQLSQISDRKLWGL